MPWRALVVGLWGTVEAVGVWEQVSEKDFPARSVIDYISPYDLRIIKNRPPSWFKSLRELPLRSLTLIEFDRLRSTLRSNSPFSATFCPPPPKITNPSRPGLFNLVPLDVHTSSHTSSPPRVAICRLGHLHSTRSETAS